ncbi:MAG: alanine racemase [Propionibacteriaceae bacterium]|nr:alanine racemase [Propionibacteriaceae bacterium]
MSYATSAIVDLDAIAANLAAVRDRAGGRRVLAAVKANAYGHGAVEVSRMIEARGAADALGVATVPEGAELRAAGVGLPILKLSHCFPGELPHAIAADLTLTVVDAASIDGAERAAAEAGRSVDVHLKLDSGMRRIGCELTAAAGLARRIADSPHLRLQGVFTHLPVSDAPGGDDYTRRQLRRFSDAVAQVQAEVGPVELVHAANSGAILGHDLGEATMVRPGIMIYGYYPDAAHTPRTVPLRPALSLVTRVSYVKDVPAGESVGYGHTWRAGHDTRVATIPVGYADGYSRLLSNRGQVLIGGQPRPIRGRVCMDQLMVEVDASVSAGDEVVLIGTQGEHTITADDLAQLMGTISYEVTCLIAPRVVRNYRPALSAP